MAKCTPIVLVCLIQGAIISEAFSFHFLASSTDVEKPNTLESASLDGIGANDLQPERMEQDYSKKRSIVFSSKVQERSRDEDSDEEEEPEEKAFTIWDALNIRYKQDEEESKENAINENVPILQKSENNAVEEENNEPKSEVNLESNSQVEQSVNTETESSSNVNQSTSANVTVEINSTVSLPREDNNSALQSPVVSEGSTGYVDLNGTILLQPGNSTNSVQVESNTTQSGKENVIQEGQVFAQLNVSLGENSSAPQVNTSSNENQSVLSLGELNNSSNPDQSANLNLTALPAGSLLIGLSTGSNASFVGNVSNTEPAPVGNEPQSDSGAPLQIDLSLSGNSSLEGKQTGPENAVGNSSNSEQSVNVTVSAVASVDSVNEQSNASVSGDGNVSTIVQTEPEVLNATEIFLPDNTLVLNVSAIANSSSSDNVSLEGYKSPSYFDKPVNVTLDLSGNALGEANADLQSNSSTSGNEKVDQGASGNESNASFFAKSNSSTSGNAGQICIQNSKSSEKSFNLTSLDISGNALSQAPDTELQINVTAANNQSTTLSNSTLQSSSNSSANVTVKVDDDDDDIDDDDDDDEDDESNNREKRKAPAKRSLNSPLVVERRKRDNDREAELYSIDADTLFNNLIN